jgi:tRNA(adenine34) deaminase
LPLACQKYQFKQKELITILTWHKECGALPQSIDQDIIFMQAALNEASLAEALGEVPIGAVIVLDGAIIGRGHNLRETSNDPTTHAEMVAIREAAENIGHWRLLDTTLYVTLEPCVMCMGAIILARIPRLVFACRDPRAGAVGSIYDFSNDEHFNHKVEVTEGVLEQKSSKMLKGFFKELRAGKKTQKTL